MPGCIRWSAFFHLRFACFLTLQAGMWLLLLLFAQVCPAVAGDEPDAFDRQIAPLLASRCLECHHGADAQGKLILSNHAAALRGGESGPALVPANPDASLLLQRVLSDEMPPKKPLTAAEKMVLTQWIREGAVWGTDPINPFIRSTDTRAGIDWWSLRPPQPTAQNSQQAFTTKPFTNTAEFTRFRPKTLCPLCLRKTLLARRCFALG